MCRPNPDSDNRPTILPILTIVPLLDSGKEMTSTSFEEIKKKPGKYKKDIHILVMYDVILTYMELCQSTSVNYNLWIEIDLPNQGLTNPHCCYDM